jgi:hypothetical protein
MAVGCFLGAEKLERALAGRADPAARATPAGRPGRLVFAGFAAVVLVGLGGLAIPSGSQAKVREVPSIGQLDLARRVFDEPWRLRVIDLRPREACAARRIPNSECVPAEELGKLGLADAAPSRDVVLVATADLAEIPPAAAAYQGRVYALRGGWAGWEAFALSAPTPPAPGASAPEVERYKLRAGIQAAMTGMKAAPPPPVPTAAPAGPRKVGGGCSG